MKTTIFAALSLLVLCNQVTASECEYKEVPATKEAYVVPMYKVTVNFVFDKKERAAFAQVFWGLDEDKTKDCFRAGKNIYPAYSLYIPRVRMDDLSVEVMGGTKKVPLNVYEESNGHWNGNAELIRLPYSTREEIDSAIKRGEEVVKINGDLRFRMTSVERKIVGQLECVEKDEEAGVLNLHRRIGEIKTQLEKRNRKEAVLTEEVLQDFLGTCVQFINVDSDSLAQFDSNQRLNSKMVKGKLPFKGNVTKEITQPMPTIAVQNASILDI